MDYTNYTDSLYHYGVKGMKWGVRRDVQLIANSRRNKTVRKAKDDYESGKINSEQKKNIIKKANADKKAYMKKVKTDYESLSSKEEKMKSSQKISKQANKEVANRRLKKGARLVSDIMTGVQVGAAAISAGAAIVSAPALAPVMAASYGAAIGINLADRQIRNIVIDKLS